MKTLYVSLAATGNIVLIVLMLAAAPSDPPKKELPPLKKADLSGYYECQGTQSGKPYEGIVVVSKVNGVYVVVWSLAGQSFTGIGKVQESQLLVGWGSETRAMRGLSIYQIGDKKLTGEVVAFPGGNAFQETLTFLKALPKVKEAE